MTGLADSALDLHSACPQCGMEWAYEGDDGQTYSHLIARVENDRVREWVCPCGARWDR